MIHSEEEAWYNIVHTEVFENVQETLIDPANLINVTMTALPITLCLANCYSVDSNFLNETFPVIVIQSEQKQSKQSLKQTSTKNGKNVDVQQMEKKNKKTTCH